MRLTVVLCAAAAALAAASPARSRVKRAAIDECLAEAAVPVDEPGSEDWTLDANPFNQRLRYTPAAIAAPTAIEHIQAAVSCAARVGIKVTPKAGGHSYASFGLGGEDGHLVVQLDRMHGVELDPETHIATVQAGARLGHVATILYDQGRRAFSHGTCPGVGVSGHALHGGFGFSSHTHGLALDWAVGATVVLANATVVSASETENPDLFWALRGAGSNFGIVASWQFKTFPAPEEVTAFEINLGWGNASAIVSGWQELQDWLASGGMPEEMNMRILGNSWQTQLQGLYHGDSSALRAAVQPLLDILGASLSNVRQYDWMGGIEHYAYSREIDITRPHQQTETLYAKSLVTPALPTEVLEKVADYWVDEARSVRRNWYIMVDMYGGPNSAITKVPADATSYAYRDPSRHLFLYQFSDGAMFGSYPEDGFQFLDGWVETFTDGLGEDWGMYINYADPRMDRATAQDVYYRESLPRLREIKRQLDPADLFYYPQAVEPAG